MPNFKLGRQNKPRNRLHEYKIANGVVFCKVILVYMQKAFSLPATWQTHQDCEKKGLKLFTIYFKLDPVFKNRNIYSAIWGIY